MGVVVLALLAVLCVGATLRSSWALALIILMFTLEQSLQGSVAIFRTQPTLANYVVAIFVGLSAVRAVFALERPFLAMVERTLWARGLLAAELVTGGIPEEARRRGPGLQVAESWTRVQSSK